MRFSLSLSHPQAHVIHRYPLQISRLHSFFFPCASLAIFSHKSHHTFSFMISILYLLGTLSLLQLFIIFNAHIPQFPSRSLQKTNSICIIFIPTNQPLINQSIHVFLIISCILLSLSTNDPEKEKEEKEEESSCTNCNTFYKVPFPRVCARFFKYYCAVNILSTLVLFLLFFFFLKLVLLQFFFSFFLRSTPPVIINYCIKAIHQFSLSSSPPYPTHPTIITFHRVHVSTTTTTTTTTNFLPLHAHHHHQSVSQSINQSL